MKCWVVRIHLSMMAFEAARAHAGVFHVFGKCDELLDCAPCAACELADHLLGVFDSDLLDELPELRQLGPAPCFLDDDVLTAGPRSDTASPRDGKRQRALESASVCIIIHGGTQEVK